LTRDFNAVGIIGMQGSIQDSYLINWPKPWLQRERSGTLLLTQ
jgi:hypothetical protein